MGWTKLEDDLRDSLEKELVAHEAKHPIPEIKRHDGSIIPEGTPVSTLLMEGGLAELEIHPDADVEAGDSRRSASVSQAETTTGGEPRWPVMWKRC